MNQILTLSIDEIADRQAAMIKRTFYIVAALIIGLCLLYVKLIDPVLVLLGGAIVALCLLPSYLWCTRKVLGTPIVPALCLNEIIWCALPILSGHKDLREYSTSEILKAGGLELLFLGTMIAIWYRFTREVPRLPESILAIPRRVLEFKGMNKVWMSALIMCSIFYMVNTSGALWPLFEFLPGGAYSVVRTFFATVSTLSIFFLSLGLGSKQLTILQKGIFFIFFILQLAAVASGLLLVDIIPLLLAYGAGYVLGSGRLPLIFILVCAFTVNLLNAGKIEMRMRYWPIFAGTRVSLTPLDYSWYYSDWLSYGWESIIAPESFYEQSEEDESLLSRTSIIQMVLYAQRRAPQHVPYLKGETLLVIPKLLIPRVFWPEKPRTHEGQILLNVKFGLQTYEDTLKTYIAWGMLAELYANFGPLGALLLGIFLGTLFGYVTKQSIEIPVGSFRFLVSLIFLVAGLSATQMSLSVWITSIFQMVLVLYVFSILFMTNRPLESFEIDRVEEDTDENDMNMDELLWQN